MAPDPCWDKGAAAVDIHGVKSSNLHFKEDRRPWRAGLDGVKFLALLLLLPLCSGWEGDWTRGFFSSSELPLLGLLWPTR